MSLHGSTQIELEAAGKSSKMQGKFKDFDFVIRELKVYKGEENSNFFKEVISEEKEYNDRIQQFKSLINNTPLGQLQDKVPFLQAIPLSPFPKIQKCIGVSPYNGKVEVLDRYMRIGFDLKVDHADESCLFEIIETEEEKFERLQKEAGIKKESRRKRRSSKK